MAPRTRSTAKNPQNPEPPTDASPEAITTTRTAKCRTLGNGSQLTYEVGTDAQDQPYIKLTAAAGGGFFSREWIALSAILAALDAWPKERPLTSYALAPLFRGKSANNPSFLAAVLVAEGLLRRMAERKRHLERAANALPDSPRAKAKRRPREGGGQKPRKASGKGAAPQKKATTGLTGSK